MMAIAGAGPDRIRGRRKISNASRAASRIWDEYNKTDPRKSASRVSESKQKHGYGQFVRQRSSNHTSPTSEGLEF